ATGGSSSSTTPTRRGLLWPAATLRWGSRPRCCRPGARSGSWRYPPPPPRPSRPSTRGGSMPASSTGSPATSGGAPCPRASTAPGARAFGLASSPLEGHRVELRIAEEWEDHPGARALVDLIASPTFHRRLEALGGYDLTSQDARPGALTH